MVWKFVKQILFDPKARMIALAVLILVLGVSRLVQLAFFGEPSVKGQASLLCPKCKYAVLKEIDSIYKEKCPKCASPMGFFYKCSECDFEFAFVPKPLEELKGMSPSELRRFKELEAKCPNCMSCKTYKSGSSR